MEDEKVTYFYDQFKKQRESEDISVSDISKKIKIQEKYIHAIENGKFNTLPTVYIRLFLKSYSSAIGLNQEKIIIEYENHLSGKGNKKNIRKTPKFIENKTHLSDNQIGQSNLLNNEYLIDSKKIITIILLVIFIVSSWIILSTISKNRYNEYQTQFSNKKLSWDFFDSLELLNSEEITINKINPENIIKYNTLIKENKILITQVENDLFIINRILNINDQGENITSNDIKFGIYSGYIDLNINGQKIDFINKNAKIIGYLYPNKKQLVLEYYK